MKLNLGIGEGDVEAIELTEKGLIDYIREIETSCEKGEFKGVWLFSTGSEFGEIIVTENLHVVINFMRFCHPYNVSKCDRGHNYFLFLNESYESAYSVAADMRECNPLHFDKTNEDYDD